MRHSKLHRLLTYLIATVWIVNGLFCKLLNLVPRHQDIVAHILGEEYAPILTSLIGVAEIVMAVWILSRIWSRFNAITQILIVLTMNILEFLLVPDLLLWGKANFVFALLFISLVYFNEFVLNKSPLQDE
ncbi:MAG: DoxX-like family protein [Chitinophagales bacterium]